MFIRNTILKSVLTALALSYCTYADIRSDSDVLDMINIQLEIARNELESAQSNISTQRREIRVQSVSIRQSWESLNKEALKLEAESALLTKKIEKFHNDSRSLQHQVKQIKDTIQFNLREFSELYSMAFPKDEQILNLLLNFDTSNRGLNELLDTTNSHYWNFIQRASSILYGSYQLYSESGEKFTANVLFVGLMGGSYWTKSESGIIYLHPESPQVRIQKSGMTRSQRQHLSSINPNDSEFLPVHLDVTDGMALQQLRTKRSWKEFFNAGGAVMFPLVIIGILALFMMIERIFYYMFFKASFKSLFKKIVSLIKEKEFEKAHDLAVSHWGPGKHFWSKGLDILKKPSSDLEGALQHLVVAQLPKLERFLTSLAVFAAICPLLGLLGTVSGMIKTFQIITLYGTSNTGMLSQGISEALITTQVGLVLAIPILLIHAMLMRQSKAIVTHLDLTTRQFIDEK